MDIGWFESGHDSTIDKSVMTFLKDVSQGVPTPVLLQLEQGRLDGMSEEETRKFIHDCGVGVASFLAPETQST